VSILQYSHVERAQTTRQRAAAGAAPAGRYARVAEQRRARNRSRAVTLVHGSRPSRAETGKQDGLFSMLERLVSNTTEIMDSVARDASGSPLDALKSYARGIVLVVLEHPPAVSVCHQHFAELTPAHRAWAWSAFAVHVDFVNELVLAVQPGGASNDELARRIVRVLATLDPAQLRRYGVPTSVIADQVTRFVVETVLDHAATRPVAVAA